MASFLFLALGLLLSPALGQSVGCMRGIQTAFGEFYFAGGAVLSYWDNLCTNELRVTSMYATGKVYCTPEEIAAGVALLELWCPLYGSVEAIPYTEIEPKLTDEFIASLPKLRYEDRGVKLLLTEPYLLDAEFAKLGVQTATIPAHQFVLHKRYGWAVYGFWGGLLVIGMASRFVSHVTHSRAKRRAIDVEGEGVPARASRLLSPFRAVHHWFRANLVIPAAFGSHHQRLYYWCTIPTRIETIIIVAFWILNFVLCCVSYEIVDRMLGWTTSRQYWRFISDRTGIISYANLPLLWMFAGRNNIFIWATGWSFSSFSVYHRHIARIATIQAIIHSIGWSVMEASVNMLGNSWSQNYWYMGGISTITMSLLMGLSSIWLRLRHYEIFLIIHVVFAVLTLVGLFYHTAVFSGEYDGYLWPCVAIWSFDRFVRFVRLAYCNYWVRFSGSPMSTRSTATYDKDADMIRIEAIAGSELIRPGPGQHYYIYQYNRLCFWENHPFTLAAWYTADDETSRAVTTPPVVSEEKTAEDITTVAVSSEGPSSSGSRSSDDEPEATRQLIPSGQRKLVFLFRPFNGWTKRLRDECLRAGPDGVSNPKLLLEGPYGEHSPVSSVENAVFVVGGTGIAGAIPYLQEHVRLTANKQTATRDITVIWSAKQSSMVCNVAARELKPYLHRDDIHFKFYATKDKKAVAAPSEKFGAVDLEILDHRPDIRGIISTVVEEVNAAGSRGGKIAVFTCGPAAMADEARVAVHRALKAGKRGLEYFEEAFGW